MAPRALRSARQRVTLRRVERRHVPRLAALGRVLGRILWDLLYPPTCVASGCSVRGSWLCTTCRARITPVRGPLCVKCGAPSPVRECLSCRRNRPAYRRAHAVGAYEGVLKDAVRALKFEGVDALAVVLGGMMAEVLQSVGSPAAVPGEGTVVVPVPAHVMRQRSAAPEHTDRGAIRASLGSQRGGRTWLVRLGASATDQGRLDHAALLALAVGDRLECDVALDSLVRVRPSRRQVGLNPAQRRANVAGVFRSTTVVVGRPVLLVDDVHTTGATVGACASALVSAGARYVSVVTVARALPPRSRAKDTRGAARAHRAHSSFEGRDGRL
jgi:predicted amidophosphoribosyltransferase